ncbi:MAG: TIGR04552 family protein [Armatimonadetes bacterium]|nr:TIGR04552 family protein [Armatimonadota bacterium]
MDEEVTEEFETPWTFVEETFEKLPPGPNGPQRPAGRFEFSWEIMRVFLEGTSPIDLSSLGLTGRKEARDFLALYGYDLDDPHEQEQALRVHVEAVAFIKHLLCPASAEGDVELVMRSEVERPADLSDLLLWASGREADEELQQWACAVLRVMHTISHANNALRSQFYPEIKRQILDRFKRHIVEDEKGNLWLGQGELPVLLHGIYFREEKSRESVILKLLHKPDNVAQRIYDRIGVKIVTSSKVGALLALKYLRKNNLVLFPNVTPGRSRNTLVDLELFRKAYEELTPHDSLEEDLRDLEFVRALEDSPEARRLEHGIENPFTSPHYRSIQFTCRQLVRVTDPAYHVVQRVRAHLQRYHAGPDLEALLEDLEGQMPERDLRFFFPYEVQILDKANHLQSEQGLSSHADYRRRQVRAARRRVLGSLARAARLGRLTQNPSEEDAPTDGVAGARTAGGG